MIGTLLSHYRILDRLGAGGMGDVYRAEDTRLGRRVAIKLLPEALAADRESRARFLAEARAAASLDHPNICMVYEFDEAGEKPFIAMQLVEGETLGQAVRRGPFDEDRVRAVVAQIASALAVAHARGVVHRDVKSANVLLGSDGSVKLADFGVARLLDETRLTRPDAMVGTPFCMAPEQITGGEVGPAADQWALGVVVYECLTGALPFRSETFAGLTHAILNETPAPPSRLRSDLSRAWDGVVARALNKAPDGRFESVEAFAAAVQATVPRTAAAASPGDRPRSLAILYFDNLSSDPESDYFCAGITEDLLTDLSKVGGLQVASRNAVGRYRGQTVDIPRVAGELGVGAVLEGSVRKAGNRVRINAQLIDAATGYHIWADRYDRTLDDVFAVQDDITASIAQALRGALTPAETEVMQLARPGDLRAYDLYLKGRAHYTRYTRDDMNRALALFEQAVEADPGYALAWAGIADACGQMIDKGWDLDPAWLERGEQAARRAVALEPRLPDGHKALALCFKLMHRVDEAERSLRSALEQDPRFVPALTNLGGLRIENGDFAGGERSLRRALQLDPAQPYTLLLLMYLCLETSRPEACIELSHLVQRWGEGSFFLGAAHCGRLVARIGLGQWEAARGEVDGLSAAGFSDATLTIARTVVEVAAGRPTAIPPPSGDYANSIVTAYLQAMLAARTGDPARLVESLEVASRVDPHSWTSFPIFVRAVDRYRPLLGSPEVQAWLGDRGRTLVWPLEAPTFPEELRGQFAEFRVETGIPPEEGIP